MQVKIEQFLHRPYSSSFGENDFSSTAQPVLMPVTVDTDSVRVLHEGYGTISSKGARELQTTQENINYVCDKLKASGRNFGQFESLFFRNKVHIDCDAIRGAKPWSLLGRPMTTMTMDDDSKVRIRGHYDLQAPGSAGRRARLVRCCGL